MNKDNTRERARRLWEEDAQRRRKFHRAIRHLNEVMDSYRAQVPEASYYLSMETLNVMGGPTHDDSWRQRDLQENVVDSSTIHRSGGGDW